MTLISVRGTLTIGSLGVKRRSFKCGSTCCATVTDDLLPEPPLDGVVVSPKGRGRVPHLKLEMRYSPFTWGASD
jgi:hypothetical protein